MTLQFTYDKKQVLEGLRSHFFGRTEIRTLFIITNVFAIVSAILFYFKKIQPLSFLIFSLLWFMLWITVRRILPLSIYKRSETFQDSFILHIEENGLILHSSKNEQAWQWSDFMMYKETLHFFLLYFDGKSFFMVPKEAFKDLTEIQAVRELLRTKITK